jgi:hypothetical protein
VLSCLLVLAPMLAPALSFAPPALAQDDDGGDDDGGDDDGGGGGGGGSRGGGDGWGRDADDRFDRRGGRRQPARAASRRQAAPAPLPTFAPAEIVALDIAAADLTAAVALGFVVLEQRDIALTGSQSARLSPPPGRTLAQARDDLRALAPTAAVDLNHYYRAGQGAPIPGPLPIPVVIPPQPCDGPFCTAFAQIGWPAPTGPASLPAGCDPGGLIGVIDTGLNADHDSLDPTRIEVIRAAPGTLQDSGQMHGTSVASILIGRDASRAPGLLPHARLIAVDAFHKVGRDERSDVFTLLSALDTLAAKGVRVINLSLAGPANTTLERMVASLSANGTLLVAAAGNDGPRAKPAFPAAYPAVIAVTAVDPRDRLYRRAVQGAHIDIAAPGVDVWVAASVKGARPRTGTSFAAPFVTAAAYLLIARGLAPAQVHQTLFDTARDLGDAGRDPAFGHGILNATTLCQNLPG